jgi:hypothetical protein
MYRSEALAQLKAIAIDLDARGAAHASVADESDDQVASSKPNDFKDFVEQ